MTGESPAPEVLRAELRAWLTARWTGPPPDAAGGRAWMAALAVAGYLGVDWPVRYGGRGLDGARALVVAEELGRAGAFPALGVIGLGMVGPTLLAAGTDAQRRRFLPPLLRGDEVWCQGFSSPAPDPTWPP